MVDKRDSVERKYEYYYYHWYSSDDGFNIRRIKLEEILNVIRLTVDNVVFGGQSDTDIQTIHTLEIDVHIYTDRPYSRNRRAQIYRPSIL